MGIISNFFLGEKRSRDYIGSNPWDFSNLDQTMDTKSGASVNENLSLSISSVWACVKIISWTKASLPLDVYKYLSNGGKQKDKQNRLYNVLHSVPNPEQTSFQFRSLLSVHQNLWGVGLAEIEYKNGAPVYLWPIPPWRCRQVRAKGTRNLYIEIRLDSGEKKYLPHYQVLVFPYLVSDRDIWVSPIAVHRETLGMALALRDFGAKTFGQGTNPSGIITHPGRIKETSEENLRRKFDQYKGLGAAHRLMLLEEGMTFTKIGLPPEDAQYLETQKHTIAEISRIYSVPLFMLGEHEKSTSWGSGIEEMKDGFIQFTMRPYLVNDEQEYNRKLFLDDKNFCEYNLDGLLRGKLLERISAYEKKIFCGMSSPNECREKENENPREGGDIYLVPMNMTTTEKLLQQPDRPDKKEDAKTEDSNTTIKPEEEGESDE